MGKAHPMSSAILKRCRKQSGLTQSAFIKRHNIQVTQATFSRWEAGKIAVPFDVLISLGLLRPVEGKYRATGDHH